MKDFYKQKMSVCLTFFGIFISLIKGQSLLAYSGTYDDTSVASALDNPGWATCGYGFMMIGIYKSTCDALHCLELFRCSKPVGSNGMTNCVDISVGDTPQAYIECPNGLLLQGFYRGSSDNIFGIDMLRCCDFTHPTRQLIAGDVTEVDWVLCLDNVNTWCTVSSNQYMTGIYRNICSELYCIENARQRAVYTVPTRNPTKNPTPVPTNRPTLRPTPMPTLGPTYNPSISPTLSPTSCLFYENNNYNINNDVSNIIYDISKTQYNQALTNTNNTITNCNDTDCQYQCNGLLDCFESHFKCNANS